MFERHMTLWAIVVCTLGVIVFLVCAVYGNTISNTGTDTYELNRQTGEYEPVHLDPGQTLDESPTVVTYTLTPYFKVEKRTETSTTITREIVN